MTTPPAAPRIYHITHVSNLASIVAAGQLDSDAVIISRGGPTTTIGMSTIKQRRLRLPVSCHQGDHVGDYVPFYFCPRSIMLYVISCQNHPELTYKGGQGPIVHLEADLPAVVQWANANGVRWAFTTSNAGAAYASFYAQLGALQYVDWNAVAATDWRNVKEPKQAEFLLRDAFPWSLVSRIGVSSVSVRGQVVAALQRATHQPPVSSEPSWYY